MNYKKLSSRRRTARRDRPMSDQISSTAAELYEKSHFKKPRNIVV